jgi:polyisoprenoid-binding protein YceI
MSWKIDTGHSHIGFAIRHMMISTTRGQFNEFDGLLALDPLNLANARVAGSVKAASIDTRDANRDAHLRSADFFDVENYPELTFSSTSIRPLGGDRYEVKGDMTIRGVTREVVFAVTDEGETKDPWGNEHRGVSAHATINRKDFGLTWNMALETGGFIVGDDVKISAEIELVKQPEGELVPA